MSLSDQECPKEWAGNRATMATITNSQCHEEESSGLLLSLESP